MIEVVYLTMTCDECETERSEDFEPSIEGGKVVLGDVLDRFEDCGYKDMGDPKTWHFLCKDCREAKKAES